MAVRPAPARRAGILERVLARWETPPPGTPTVDALDRLHRAWLAQVPFENASKLIKAARVMAPDAAVRGPVEFWEDHLRWGSGGTCFASTYAWQFLLRYLGYPSQLLFCHLPAEKPQAHTALLVEAEGQRWLVDVGYALPVPLPVPGKGAVRRRTPYYDVEVRRGPGDEVLVFSEDARGQRFRYRVRLGAVSEAAYLEAWRHTFALTAPYMKRLALGRFRDGTRYLYKEEGRVYAIDRAGERLVPLEGAPDAALAGIFALPRPLLAAALSALAHLKDFRGGRRATG